jgi:hypothetical protein
MGVSNGRVSNLFRAYESIKTVQKLFEGKNFCLNLYLISVNSIKNFISLIENNHLLGNESKDDVKKFKDDLNDYETERNIKIYSKYQECKELIEEEKKDENNFIIVNENFLIGMEIQGEHNEKVEINYNKENNKMEIEFRDSKLRLLFERNGSIFFRFVKSNEDKNIEIQWLLSNIEKLKNEFKQEKYEK